VTRRFRPHAYLPDRDTPADPLDPRQRHPCQVCHVVGEQGDAHHPDEAPDVDAQQRAAGDDR